jgi:hypothetical protein
MQHPFASEQSLNEDGVHGFGGMGTCVVFFGESRKRCKLPG